MGRLCVQLLAALLLAVPAGGGEIYRWTDEQGRTHFTQDLSQVPRKHRSRARASSSEDQGGSLVRSEISSPPARRDASGSRPAGRRQVTRIKVQRAGTSMRVVAVLNGRVRAPFIVDTGASDVTIPRWVADELDIEVTSRTRRQIYQTANGRIEEPVVTLRSVDLGGAVAENVAASISSTMPVGLLGLSFFNRFRYQVDPQHGVITLEPNGILSTRSNHFSMPAPAKPDPQLPVTMVVTPWVMKFILEVTFLGSGRPLVYMKMKSLWVCRSTERTFLPSGVSGKTSTREAMTSACSCVCAACCRGAALPSVAAPLQVLATRAAVAARQ